MRRLLFTLLLACNLFGCASLPEPLRVENVTASDLLQAVEVVNREQTAALAIVVRDVEPEDYTAFENALRHGLEWTPGQARAPPVELALSPALDTILFSGQSAPSFVLPLQTSLVPERANGSATATFGRNLASYVLDFEDRPVLVPANAARMQGARIVQNLIPAAGSGSASLAVSANKTVTVGVGTFVFSMGAVATADSVITFTGTATGLPVGTLTANATKRTSIAMTITVGGTVIMTASDAIAVNLQFENTTGQTNQNPSEYVSVGVLSAPYHGLGVDGIKAFDTLNGNTVP